MKNLIKLTIAIIATLSHSCNPAYAQADITNPVGLYRGIPYLSPWGQNFIIQATGAQAATFWLSDTNAALAFWNFIQPYAFSQNTNALTPAQSNALANATTSAGVGSQISASNLVKVASSYTSLNYNPYRIIAVGDSLTTTNPSTLISYPMVLAGKYGYNVLTNTAQGGRSTGYISQQLMDAAYPCFPTHTGNRATLTVMFGRNDFNTSITTTLQALNAATSVIANAQSIITKAAGAGANLLVISCPYIYNTPAAEPGRAVLTQWEQSLTNQGIAFVNYDNVAPPSTWTNSDGSLNTSVTADGVHLTAAVNTNLATAIDAAIRTSFASTQPQLFANPDAAWYYPTVFGTGSAVTNFFNNTPTVWAMQENGNTAFTIEEAYGGDIGTHFIPVCGTTFACDRDAGGGSYDWGFRFVNQAQNLCPLFVDTAANCVVVGITNNGGYVGQQFHLGWPATFWPVNQDINPGGDGNNVHVENNWIIQGQFHVITPGGQFGFGQNGTFYTTNVVFYPMNQIFTAGSDGNNVHFENVWAQQGKFNLTTPGGLFTLGGNGTFTATNLVGKLNATNITGGYTTNIQFTFGSTRTNTLYFTNGILMNVTQP